MVRGQQDGSNENVHMEEVPGLSTSELCACAKLAAPPWKSCNAEMILLGLDGGTKGDISR